MSTNKRVAALLVLAACSALLSPALGQAGGSTPLASAKEEVVPDQQPKPALPPANSAAAVTVRELAARARASRFASEPLAGSPSQSVLGQHIPAGGPIPLAPQGSGNTTGSRQAFEPRLISIVGGRGKERVELALGGVVYTVSPQHPTLGTTGWRLTDVNPEDASVRIAAMNEAPRRKGQARAYVLGFSRRDPDLQARGEQQPLATPGVPVPGFPTR